MFTEGNASPAPGARDVVALAYELADLAPASLANPPVLDREVLVPRAAAAPTTTAIHPFVPVAVPRGATEVNGDQVTRVLVGGMLALAALHLAALYLRHGLGFDYAHGMVPLFDFNLEANAPTWFSSALLLGVGLVAALIALRASHLRGYWFLVAGIAVFLSLDESVQLHELATRLLRAGLAVGPGFSVTVVAIVSLLPVLVGAALFYRFLRALPRGTAMGLLAAGAVYLTGAVGVDTAASVVAFGGEGGAIEVALNTIEELLEMSGLILAIRALLAQLQRTEGRAPTAAPVGAR